MFYFGRLIFYTPFIPLLFPFYIGPYILRYMSVYSPLHVRIYIDTDY